MKKIAFLIVCLSLQASAVSLHEEAPYIKIKNTLKTPIKINYEDCYFFEQQSIFCSKKEVSLNGRGERRIQGDYSTSNIYITNVIDESNHKESKFSKDECYSLYKNMILNLQFSQQYNKIVCAMSH